MIERETSLEKLAINGGKPVRGKKFPPYITIGEEEKEAVLGVLDSGVLSKYLGCWHKDFYGGSQVKALEKEWAEYFGVKHAISVNSCTSGLYCSAGAIGVEPGEEIIVTPYTMTATATAPLIFNAIPVFVDIEEDYFCLDVNSVEKHINSRTRAIFVVDLFGMPYDVEAINILAKKHGLVVVEDAAQAPGAKYKDKFAGTLADIGVYSLNYHKHIHCGEGGIVVTDNDMLAENIRLLRNHAEAVVENKGVQNIANMIGFNFRMTEIEASIARCQLQKLDNLLNARRQNCYYLSRKLGTIPAITIAKVRKDCTHAYYVLPFTFNETIAGVSRDKYIEAVKAELPLTTNREDEGVLIGCGYVKPLYLQPLYQKRIAYGTKGFPFKSPVYGGEVDYSKGICPVAERMYEKELFFLDMIHPAMTREDLNDVAKAFEKVWKNRTKL